jgi:hypothetical protein
MDFGYPAGRSFAQRPLAMPPVPLSHLQLVCQAADEWERQQTPERTMSVATLADDLGVYLDHQGIPSTPEDRRQAAQRVLLGNDPVVTQEGPSPTAGRIEPAVPAILPPPDASSSLVVIVPEAEAVTPALPAQRDPTSFDCMKRGVRLLLGGPAFMAYGAFNVYLGHHPTFMGGAGTGPDPVGDALQQMVANLAGGLGPFIAIIGAGITSMGALIVGSYWLDRFTRRSL